MALLAQILAAVRSKIGAGAAVRSKIGAGGRRFCLGDNVRRLKEKVEFEEKHADNKCMMVKAANSSSRFWFEMRERMKEWIKVQAFNLRFADVRVPRMINAVNSHPFIATISVYLLAETLGKRAWCFVFGNEETKRVEKLEKKVEVVTEAHEETVVKVDGLEKRMDTMEEEQSLKHEAAIPSPPPKPDEATPPPPPKTEIEAATDTTPPPPPPKPEEATLPPPPKTETEAATHTTPPPPPPKPEEATLPPPPKTETEAATHTHTTPPKPKGD